MRRLPMACWFISPSLENRCCSTRAHVLPQASSPQSADRACRRSPGGRQPNSLRSRPDEPPSSATVPIAVRSSTTRRRADRLAASPCPPPKATTRGPSRSATSLTAEVPVSGTRVETAVEEPPNDLLGHGHAAVLATGAPERDRHEPLALAEVAGADVGHQRHEALEEVPRTGLGHHVVTHGDVAAGLRPQLRHPVQVGQEAHVRDVVGIDGYAVLETEAHDVDLEPEPLLGAERTRDLSGELVH